MRLTVILLILLFLAPSFIIPQSHKIGFDNTVLLSNIPSFIIPDKSQDMTPIESNLSNSLWSIADEDSPLMPVQGILNPITIEQTGYSSTSNLSARTDTLDNTVQVMTIDTSHNWVASQAQIDIWNLERLYVINGTFDDGFLGYTINPNGILTNYPLGWTAISTSGDIDQEQQVSYEESNGRYVTVQNKGDLTNSGQKEYTHYAGTTVLWNQTFDNVPFTNDFQLQFNYLYLRGPLAASFSGKFSLKIFLDGSPIWSINLPTINKRGTWFESGIVPISASLLPGSSSFKIGLVIDATFTARANIDYDSDGIEDGVFNAEYITVYIDDVSLISSTPPNCEEVDLQLSCNSLSSSISGGSENGSGLLENETYWTTGSIQFDITANTSISFDFRIRLLNHRFLDSIAAMETLQVGVEYLISPSGSGILRTYAYLGFIGLYQDFVLRIYHPVDWQNFTIRDPFLTDMTPQCFAQPNYIEIPTHLLDLTGWWKISCQSPNYAMDAVVERYDSDATEWVNETVFHSTDNARISVSIGFNDEVPLLSNPVNFTWFLANSTPWFDSSTTSGLNGIAISDPVTFDGTNTTAGPWGVIYHWSNGTEIAYGYTRLYLHHQAILEIVFLDDLETVVGQPVTIILRFYDIENGMLLLNNGAEINGSWAGGVVQFEPNVVKNWWQADFDTGLVGAGIFDVTITSASDYFETVPLILTIKSNYLTSLNAPTGPLEPLIYGRAYSFDFIYIENYGGTGIEGAVIGLAEEGHEWISVTETGNGHYNLTLTPLGLHDYSIQITFSKIGYYNQAHYLNFLVKKVPVKVTFLTDLRGDELKSLEVRVGIAEVDTDKPVTDANATLNIVSRGGVVYASETMDETSPGIYVATIIMPMAGEITYSAIISLEKENYELAQSFSDTLIPNVDTNARLFQTVMNYSFQIAFAVGVLGSVIVSQKYYSRRRREKQANARVIKARFSDANNLIGTIVLHKLSGIPIYSKIFKGGLEEGMLSAFITAIMHFRSEFETAGSTGEYKILPISDIVRAVPTENLVCAFITITSASKEQEARMMSYARAIGMMLDDALAQPPTQVIDVKTMKTLEWLFDDFVDGGLLRDYQIGEKTLPKNLRCIGDVLKQDKPIQAFKLINLIRLLESCGIYEDDAYIIVMDAIDNEYILPLYPYNNTIDTDTIKA